MNEYNIMLGTPLFSAVTYKYLGSKNDYKVQYYTTTSRPTTTNRPTTIPVGLLLSHTSTTIYYHNKLQYKQACLPTASRPTTAAITCRLI